MASALFFVRNLPDPSAAAVVARSSMVVVSLAPGGVPQLVFQNVASS